MDKIQWYMSFQNETTMNIIENQASPYKLRKTSFSVCVPHGFSYDYLLFIDIMYFLFIAQYPSSNLLSL